MDEVPDQELEVTSSKLKPARTEVGGGGWSYPLVIPVWVIPGIAVV